MRYQLPLCCWPVNVSLEGVPRDLKNYIRGFSKGERLGEHCLNSAERWNREITGGTGFSTDIGSRKYAELQIDVDADSNKPNS